MRYAGLVAGLGNPGRKYDGTRHNMGYMFVDALLDIARREGDLDSLNGKKFNAELWRVELPQLAGRWLVAKPLTFMNDSGRSIQPLLAWHGLGPGELLVVQDEMDLPAGALRFRFGGGLAGHRGLLSISQCLGTQDFYRLRIGIGKPRQKDDTLAWVLGGPDARDRNLIRAALPFALNTLFIFARDGLAPAVQYAHGAAREIENEQSDR